MSTKKAISTSFVAIFILIITQIIAQSIASMFVIIKIPTGICNIIAGIIYAGLTYLILKMFISKIIKLPTSDFGMPKFAIKIRWILIAVLLPFVIKGSYLLIFNGKYVSSNMNGNQMFNTLSAGVAFTGIAAGFVEEMVFRGVILNALKKRWNIKVAVIVPSMLFGIVHVLGQDFSIGSCLLVIIAGTMVGVMFSMIAIESGSVWNSGIVHAIWNVVIIGGGLAIGEKMDKYEEARDWYEKEAAEQTWSVRTLQRNISSQYYYRMLGTQKKELVENEMKELTASYQNDKLEFIKNPVVAEFLGFSQNTDFTESDLEKSILSNLQKFLMELGKGYAFVARQQHIHTEKQDYYIDLVFYNYILKCFVLIDLKTEKITHQDVGQMDMYIRMYDELKRSEGDNPTIGIVLCSDTDDDIARYSVMHGNEQLFASKYKLYLPTKEELKAEIETQKAMFYLQQQENEEKETE